jgi:hypothetical protein
MEDEMPSKTTMRRHVTAKGGYYSRQAQRWVFVGKFGATYWPSLADAYDEIDAAVAGQYHTEDGEWAFSSRGPDGRQY